MKSILGIGNALTDILAVLPDDSLLQTYHLPLGSMQHVDMETGDRIWEALKGYGVKYVPGGSAANIDLDVDTDDNYYEDRDDERILPFISDQKYNEAIKEIFKLLPKLDRVVTILDPVTRLEKQVKLSEVASSHMGRRNFCGNLYEAGFRDSDIASMSGHAEGSKAISRYRKVSDETKKKMIKSL